MMGKQKKSLLAISVQRARLKIKCAFKSRILDINAHAGLTVSFNKINALETIGRNEKPKLAQGQTETCLKRAVWHKNIRTNEVNPGFSELLNTTVWEFFNEAFGKQQFS